MIAYLIVKSSVVLFSGRSVDSTDSMGQKATELLNSVRIVGTKSHGRNAFPPLRVKPARSRLRAEPMTTKPYQPCARSDKLSQIYSIYGMMRTAKMSLDCSVDCCTFELRSPLYMEHRM